MISTEVLRIEALSKTYLSGGRPHRALKELDLSLRSGEIFGFLGPNGAGKSTTIRILLGLLRPTSGSARILGKDCWRESVPVRASCGYLAGDARFYTGLTGLAQLELLAKLRRRDCDYLELAERLGLPLERRIKGYSKGMGQKLGIIQAIMHRPPLVILDEPTSALDPLVQDEVLTILGELRDAGTTIFFSSHVLSEVQKVCDRVALVRAGELLRQETVDGMEELEIYRVRVSCANSEVLAEELRAAGFQVEEDAGQLTFTDRGSEDIVVKLLAGYSIDRLRIEPLGLEEIFLELYRSADAAAPTSGGPS